MKVVKNRPDFKNKIGLRRKANLDVILNTDCLLVLQVLEPSTQTPLDPEAHLHNLLLT